ncbi:HAD family hydrolase [Candidatus Parcubacteria bacterium]|nr:MAG: HAD family hydrolase [Candidatus Parcubacteria bacterium]
MKKAIFIDKDGTLVHDVPYNVNPQLITLKADAGQILKRLKDHGYLLIIISNQTGVARGLFPKKSLNTVSQRIQELLKPWGIAIDDFFFCPHDINGKVAPYIKQCECHKPQTGMFLKAVKKYNIDISASWSIGDKLSDIEASRRVGCKAILLSNNNISEDNNYMQKPDFIIKEWQEIINIINL